MLEIQKAAGIIIKNRRLLVERSKDKEHFISPGGSIEEGESAPEALVRELKEEFQIEATLDDLEYFNTFSAAAAGDESRRVVMEVFRVKSYRGDPTPNNEVEEIRWITSEIPQDIKVGSIFEHDVIPELKKQGLID